MFQWAALTSSRAVDHPLPFILLQTPRADCPARLLLDRYEHSRYSFRDSCLWPSTHEGRWRPRRVALAISARGLWLTKALEDG